MGFDSERIESHSTVFRNMMSDKPIPQSVLDEEENLETQLKDYYDAL